jgi:RHS repeat-associated protein
MVAYVRGIGLIASKTGNTFSYYLFNGHGDVVQLSNASGVVVRAYDYDAFGVEREIDEDDTNPFRYCGEYYDSETGTVYLRARYYSPKTGRFATEDPIRAGLNWYTYANNNPIMFIDPWGLDAILINRPLGGSVTGVLQKKVNV